MLDPSATWHNTRAFPGPSVLKGPREIIGFYRGLLEEFERGEFTIERVVEIGAGVVLDLHSRSLGRASHVPLDVRWAALVTVGERRVTRIDVYGSFERALEAAG